MPFPRNVPTGARLMITSSVCAGSLAARAWAGAEGRTSSGIRATLPGWLSGVTRWHKAPAAEGGLTHHSSRAQMLLSTVARRVGAGVPKRPLAEAWRAMSAVAAAAPPPAAQPARNPSATVVSHPPLPNTLGPEEIPDGCEPRFAIIKLSGTQYKVTLDDVIATQKINGPDIGEVIDIKDVLLVGTRDKTVVGRPLVPGSRVELMVEEHVKAEKVVVFKMRRRKSSRRKHGFRREMTVLRVLDIKCKGLEE